MRDTVSRYRWALVLVATAVLATGCVAAASPAWLDGHEVEGVWVSNESFPCPFGEECARAMQVARSALLDREPNDKIVAVTYHRSPVKSSDPNILGVTSLPFHAFVLTLADGSERVEAFGCDVGGGLMVSHVEGFAQFCPRPHTEPPLVTTTMFDLVGSGPLEWAHHLDAGRYGFPWRTTAAGVACDARVVLKGPAGSAIVGQRHLDPYMTGGSGDVSVLPSPSAGEAVLVDVRTGESPPPAGTPLVAGTYTLRLETDCPGESHLGVVRIVGS